jgi:hypothetical protein
MIPVPSGVRVWLVTGHTDMRKGFGSLALLVQESLKRDPFDGNLFIFRGRRGELPTFYIRFSLCDDRLSLAPFVWIKAYLQLGRKLAPTRRKSKESKSPYRACPGACLELSKIGPKRSRP